MANSLGGGSSTTTEKKNTSTVQPVATVQNTAIAPAATTTTNKQTTSSLGSGTSTSNAATTQSAYPENYNTSTANTGVSYGNDGLGRGGTSIQAVAPGVMDAAADEAAAEPEVAPYAINSDYAKAVQEYLNNYNIDREQKIRDMYAGNITAQNAQQKTAYDASAAALKNAYNAKTGNLDLSKLQSSL